VVKLAQNQGKVVRVGELNKPYLVWGTQSRLGTVCGEAIRHDPLMGRAQSINVQIHPCPGIREKLTNIRDRAHFTGLSPHVTFMIVFFSVH